ncbi:hypothetical protein [Aliikangiella sp. IMCC44632]
MGERQLEQIGRLNATDPTVIFEVAKLTETSFIFFQTIAEQIQLKTLRNIMLKMATQRKAMLSALVESRAASYATLKHKPLINEPANSIAQWYQSKLQQDQLAFPSQFIEELEFNERKLLSFYRQSIRNIADEQLVKALASHIASIQITFDKLRQSRFD